MKLLIRSTTGLSLVGLLFLYSSCQKKAYQYNEGFIFGTIYHIQYQNTNDIQQQIDSVLKVVDYSLSTYKPESVLSKINTNESQATDAHFRTVFNKGQEVSAATNGAFDMTVSSLVNAWGFGFKTMDFPDSTTIDSLMQYVGYKKIKLENNLIIKANPNVNIDASAIAKGYGVDAVADYLEAVGIKNYLIEIGGEIRLKGKNNKNMAWSVGIDKPIDDLYNQTDELQEIIVPLNGGVATSGNYRRFYIKDGKKYAHTIDPFTGYPVAHNILSATVCADDCMTADAYATAMMVMSLKESQDFLNKHPELSVYLIYAKDSTSNEVWMNDRFKKIIVQD
ncbi:MAG: FAD:protein FMN transferase [Bacteroidales bacterium]|nr:FAD:protein FMN transferase [Bacteroidales bacterium]